MFLNFQAYLNIYDNKKSDEKIEKKKNELKVIMIRKHLNKPNYWNKTLQAIAKQL